MRVLLAVVLGAGMVSVGAVVLGDYPLSGAVPWMAAIIIPGLAGVVMTTTAGRGAPIAALWVLAGVLGGAGLAWGIRIATGWGLDAVPTSAWASIAIGATWPVITGSAIWVSTRSKTRPTGYRRLLR